MFKRLGDVIDKNKLFSMLYSGVEDTKNFNILYDLGIRDFLISFHYIQQKNLDINIYADRGIKFFIDSGAYTYMNNPDYNERTVEEWEEHIKFYLLWAKEHKDLIFALASFDLENLVGAEQVQKWNEKYFEPFMLETGIPVCFVWHNDNYYLTWEQYCQRYPYVGVSWGTDVYDDGSGGLKTGISMLRVAEKYGAVVHGMAMTRTSLLPKLPFYTVDSTTWMVGVQYGEVNYWTGKKMTRLKKDKWKGEMLETIVNELGRNKEFLLAEDSSEMIRVNVQAFIQAEKYIKEKMKNKMYWLKPTITKQSINDITFPTLSDIADNNFDWEYYADSFNVSKEDPQIAKDLIVDITCFLNWEDGDYIEFIEKTYDFDLIKDLHDTWVNKVVASNEERIEDLQNFFTECVEGKNEKLLHLGTNFDRVAKERDYYIEEETEELVDISDEELINSLGNALPPPSEESGAIEIDSLDDEIFSDKGLVAVRDSKGRFLKGQKKVKKPKNIYSEKYPKLVCNTCHASQNCPEFKEGYVCAFNKMFKRFDCRNTDDILEAMQGMVNLNMERMQRTAIFEMLDGGVADSTLTGMIDQNMRLLMNMKSVMENNQPLMSQTKTIHSDGSVSQTTTVNKPSILEGFFSSMKEDSKPKEDEVIEVDDFKEDK